MEICDILKQMNTSAMKFKGIKVYKISRSVKIFSFSKLKNNFLTFKNIFDLMIKYCKHSINIYKFYMKHYFAK
jgi:hypothetical protein